MPQETKSMPSADGPGSPAGQSFELGDAEMTAQAIERAFDFRGDVTLTLADGRTVSGYLFDRVRAASTGDSYIRLMPATAGDANLKIRYAEIRRLAFSDRDPAAGKSFETWIKKYVEKKLAGEEASIESESLE
jgi:hypothetical protein